LALFFVIAPYYLTKLAEKIQLKNLLSDVVVCFLVGILLGNTRGYWMPDTTTQETANVLAKVFSAASVLVAIPMLLMVSDIRAFVRYASKLILSFVLCIVAALLAVVITSVIYKELPHIGAAAGMMTGVYIGGTPNMVGVSYAVNAPHHLFLILTTTDLFVCGLYFLFLTSVAKAFFGLFLPKFKTKLVVAKDTNQKAMVEEAPFPPQPFNIQTVMPLIKALGWAGGCIALSVGVGFLIPNAAGELNEMLLMIVLTTLSIACSFLPQVQSLRGVYNFAQYLLLIFAVAVGFMADFSTLADQGLSYLTYNAIIIIGMLVLHLLFSMLFRIDTDTFIITSTACIFGPPFIGQICSVIKNKELLPAGMALGVLGLIIGNYLGIVVYSLVEQLL